MAARRRVVGFRSAVCRRPCNESLAFRVSRRILVANTLTRGYDRADGEQASVRDLRNLHKKLE
jgi:hypothetical protein